MEVMGLVFNESGTKILLIKEIVEFIDNEFTKPAFNAIHGKVKENEDSIKAMMRVFYEFTDIPTAIERWDCVVDMYVPDPEPAEYNCIEYFRMFMPESFFMSLDSMSFKNEKYTHLINSYVNPILPADTFKRIPLSLTWIIPLSLDDNILFPVKMERLKYPPKSTIKSI